MNEEKNCEKCLDRNAVGQDIQSPFFHINCIFNKYKSFMWVVTALFGAALLLTYSNYENINIISLGEENITFILFYALFAFSIFYIVSGLFLFPTIIRSISESYFKDEALALFTTDNTKNVARFIKWGMILSPTIIFVFLILLTMAIIIFYIDYYERFIVNIDISFLLLFMMFLSAAVGFVISYFANKRTITKKSILISLLLFVNIVNMLFVVMQFITVAKLFIGLSDNEYMYLAYMLFAFFIITALNIVLFVNKLEFFSATAFVALMLMFEIVIFIGPDIVGGRILRMLHVGGRIPIEVTIKNEMPHKFCLLLNREKSVIVREITEEKKCILDKKYTFKDSITIPVSADMSWRVIDDDNGIN